MTIIVTLTPDFARTKRRCPTCHSIFKPQREVAGELHEDGERVGLICDDCLEAGEDGLRTRMEKCAVYLTDFAKGLRESAAEKIVVPTAAEITRCNEEERAAWAEENAKYEAGRRPRIPTTAPTEEFSDEIPF